MKSKFLTQLFTDTPMTVAGLILFFVSFLGLVAWVYFRREARAHYQAMAELALQNDRGGSHE